MLAAAAQPLTARKRAAFPPLRGPGGEPARAVKGAADQAIEPALDTPLRQREPGVREEMLR